MVEEKEREPGMCTGFHASSISNNLFVNYSKLEDDGRVMQQLAKVYENQFAVSSIRG